MSENEGIEMMVNGLMAEHVEDEWPPNMNMEDYQEADTTGDQYAESEEAAGASAKLCPSLGISVTNEEVERLRRFQVLDETTTDEGEDARANSDDSMSGDSTTSDIPDDDIEAMLDEQLPSTSKGPQQKRDKPFEYKKKVVLIEKGINHFEVLPSGWITITHVSGMPVYLHKETRVCSMAKPYLLGPSSVRRHNIPISAVPCLKYQKVVEEEKEMQKRETERLTELLKCSGYTLQDQDQNSVDKNGPSAKRLKLCRPEKDTEGVAVLTDTTLMPPPKQLLDKRRMLKTQKKDISCSALIGQPLVLPDSITMPTANIETAHENFQKSHLTHEALREYCEKVFQFKTLTTMKFTSWSQKRKYIQMRKVMQRPTLPDGTKLISIPVRNTIINTTKDGTAKVVVSPQTGKHAKKEWILNPNGRSYVCIFHEYVQRVLKEQPTYEYEELENAVTPYMATVSIGKVKYGVGYGTSKRQAKAAAAKASLEILIPDMKDKITQDMKIKGHADRPTKEDFTFFNEIPIDDPRIAEFCEKTMEPSPHSILETCLLRNFGSGDREIKTKVESHSHKKIAFTMTVGSHSKTVFCQNKKEGKQRSSQAILQCLHPHVTSWGSLLRLYGSRSAKNFKEKKQEEQEITMLQNKAAINQPNFAILGKLKEAMTDLHMRDQGLAPIDTIVVEEQLPSHSDSNLKNVDL